MIEIHCSSAKTSPKVPVKEPWELHGSVTVLGASQQNKTKKLYLKWQHPSNKSQPSLSECSCQCEYNVDASSLHPTGNYSAQSLKLELCFAINKSNVIPLVCVEVGPSQVINEKWQLIQMIDALFIAGLIAFEWKYILLIERRLLRSTTVSGRDWLPLSMTVDPLQWC